MKRFITALVLFVLSMQSAHAQFVASALRVNQRTADNTAFVGRDIPPPPGPDDGILVMGGATKLPVFVTLGTGLSITDGVLNSASGGVNADWNATTGLARILNKPTISTVGMTGQYADLLGKPMNVSDFANDAGYVTNTTLSSSLGNYATTSTLTAGLAGKETAGAAAAAQAFAIQRANHTGTQPASTITGLATVATSGSYNDLTNKPVIPAATPFNFGAPAARTVALSTAYQANDPTKAAIVTVSPQCSASLTLAGGSTCTLQARIGSGSLTCSTGTVVAQWANGNTGALTVGLSLNQIVGSPASLNVPIGASFILCPVSGTFTLNSVVDQSAG